MLSILVFALVAAGGTVDTERILARGVVPEPARRVGEVRLIERGDSIVVQTLLYTKVLKRVVGEIRGKEERNWLPGAPGYDESRRFVAALEAAREAVWKEAARLERGADREQCLLIEFVAGPRHVVTLAVPEIDRKDGEVRITATRPLQSLDLSAEYIRRNMLLILDDSLHLGEGEVRQLAPRLFEGR